MRKREYEEVITVTKTEYIAFDEKVFTSERDCVLYEKTYEFKNFKVDPDKLKLWDPANWEHFKWELLRNYIVYKKNSSSYSWPNDFYFHTDHYLWNKIENADDLILLVRCCVFNLNFEAEKHYQTVEEPNEEDEAYNEFVFNKMNRTRNRPDKFLSIVSFYDYRNERHVKTSRSIVEFFNLVYSSGMFGEGGKSILKKYIIDSCVSRDLEALKFYHENKIEIDSDELSKIIPKLEQVGRKRLNGEFKKLGSDKLKIYQKENTNDGELEYYVNKKDLEEFEICAKFLLSQNFDFEGVLTKFLISWYGYHSFDFLYNWLKENDVKTIYHKSASVDILRFRYLMTSSSVGYRHKDNKLPNIHLDIFKHFFVKARVDSSYKSTIPLLARAMRDEAKIPNDLLKQWIKNQRNYETHDWFSAGTELAVCVDEMKHRERSLKDMKCDLDFKNEKLVYSSEGTYCEYNSTKIMPKDQIEKNFVNKIIKFDDDLYICKQVLRLKVNADRILNKNEKIKLVLERLEEEEEEEDKTFFLRR